MTQSAPPYPGRLRAWLVASRPPTLTAALAPVLVGTAIAHHVGARQKEIGGEPTVELLPALATFLGAILLQIGSNFANDVFDFEKGADTSKRLGPTRAVQAGWVTTTQMKRGLGVVFALALGVGAYLVSIAGWPIVIIGLCSMLAAVAYTGGPYPLGYNGLGDLFVLVFFGFVAVLGTVFVHLGAVPYWAWLPAAGMGAVTTNILVVNNVRDRHTDQTVGKRTMAVRFGRRGAEIEYLGLYVLGYAVPVSLVATGLVGPWIFLCWVTLPLAWKNFRALRALEGAALNGTLVGSAQLVFLYGLSLALGLALDTIG